MKLLIGFCLALASMVAAAETTIPVLIYHRVIPEAPSDTVITPDMFTKHMDMIQKMGYETVTMEQVVQFMQGKIKLSNKTVAITFDDGWKDHLVAAKILNDRKMAATFYVLSGTFEHHMYLNKEELVRLSRYKNFEIGAHSHTHYVDYASDLDKLDTRKLVGEMFMSRVIIEEVIGKKVTSFAWPFGYSRPDALALAPSMGFTSTVHVNGETDNKVGTSVLHIKRLNINGACSPDDIRAMLETRKLKVCR